jgi:hypothetical protein
VSKEEWKEGGFKRRAVCKQCFEKRVPSPHYLSIDEYIRARILAKEGSEAREQVRTILTEIWEMPAELEKFDEETGKSLSRTEGKDIPIAC